MTLNGKAYSFEYCMLLIVIVECVSVTEGNFLKDKSQKQQERLLLKITVIYADNKENDNISTRQKAKKVQFKLLMVKLENSEFFSQYTINTDCCTFVISLRKKQYLLTID